MRPRQLLFAADADSDADAQAAARAPRQGGPGDATFLARATPPPPDVVAPPAHRAPRTRAAASRETSPVMVVTGAVSERPFPARPLPERPRGGAMAWPAFRLHSETELRELTRAWAAAPRADAAAHWAPGAGLRMPRTERALGALVDEIRARPAPTDDDEEVPALHAGDLAGLTPRTTYRVPALLIARQLPNLWRSRGVCPLELLAVPLPSRGGAPGSALLVAELRALFAPHAPSEGDVERTAGRLEHLIDGGDLAATHALGDLARATFEVVHAQPPGRLTALFARAVA